MDTHSEKVPFFGGDGRGKLFDALFCKSIPVAINESDSNSILGGTAWSAMIAKNYETKKATMDDNDIHYEFTDFIINTGIFHRALDTPTGFGPAAFTGEEDVRRGSERYLLSQPGQQQLKDLANPANRQTAAGLIAAGTVTANVQPQVTKALVDYAATTQNITNDAASDVIMAEVKKFHEQARTHTPMTGDAGKLLCNEVYTKWSSLSRDSQSFYRTFINVIKKDGSIADESEYESVCSAGEYRFNMVKRRMGDAMAKFANVIPLLPTRRTGRGGRDAWTGKVWYTDANGVVQSTGNTDVTALRKLYEDAYIGGGVRQNRSTTLARFSLWSNRLIRERLYAMKAPQPVVVEEGEKVYDMVTKNVWCRDKNDPTRFYTEENGQRKYFGSNDDNTLDKLKLDNNCASTYFSGDVESCKKYIFEFLLNGDSMGLQDKLKLLQSQDFSSVAAEEVKNMHPLIALKTLQRFGFQTYETYDREAKMTLKKVCNTAHWKENAMKGKFKETEVQQAIEKNKKLVDYLELLVQYVNANPSIVNKNFVNCKTEESVGRTQPTDYAKRLQIPQRTENYGVSRGLYDMAVMRNYHRTGFFGATFNRPLLGLSSRGTLMTPFGDFSGSSFGAIMPLSGGGNGLAEAYAKRSGQGVLCGSDVINNLFVASINEMKRHNKSLDSAEWEAIKEKIANMKAIETDLVKTLRYVDEYNTLLDALRDYNDQVLSVSALKSLVDRYNNLLTKYGTEEMGMIKIIEALQKLVAGVGVGKTNVTDL